MTNCFYDHVIKLMHAKFHVRILQIPILPVAIKLWYKDSIVLKAARYIMCVNWHENSWSSFLWMIIFVDMAYLHYHIA